MLIIERALATKEALYYTKVGNCNRGLVAKRGLFKLLTNINHILCDVKFKALSDSIIQ
jgi:hypothetical protein